MTGETSVALVNISTHAGVLLVGLRWGMTCRAGKDGVVICVGMTFGTLIPRAFMSAAVYREILIIMIAVFRR